MNKLLIIYTREKIYACDDANHLNKCLVVGELKGDPFYLPTSLTSLLCTADHTGRKVAIVETDYTATEFCELHEVDFTKFEQVIQTGRRFN